VPTATAATPVSFTVVGLVGAGASGEITNVITVTSATTEGYPADNHDLLVTLVEQGPVAPPVLVEALYADAYEYGQVDEAFRLVNVSSVTVDIGGWGVTDGESSPATFLPGTILAPGQAVWCAREALAFARQFGFKSDYEYGDDTDPTVPDMDGGTPLFSNDDECVLQNAGGHAVDVLVFGDGTPPGEGWSGEAVQPWTSGDSFAARGQILYRKREQATGLPLPDADTAADWAQDPGDHLDGRKVLYPGWDLDAFFFTQRVTETATLTVVIAPDHAFESLAGVLASAEESIEIGTYTFESRELAEVLLDRLYHGVSVTILLEGAPSFTGVTDQEKWIARHLYDAGAEILFMINDDEYDVHDRYDSVHAKYAIVDGQFALIGSENLNNTGMPADDKADGTAGRRGIVLLTDAPGVVARVRAVFQADADLEHHEDVVGCEHRFGFCDPPQGFEAEWTPDWTTYTVQFPAPLVIHGTFAFEVVHSPENSLRLQDGLLGLLALAGPGDTLRIEQFYERVHWGSIDGTPEMDPNPRLEAYLDAARRGAAVRILLDGHFDERGENAATVAYLRDIARAERLDLQARLGDPAYLGLHNKMVLAWIDGQGYVHAGSINGSETSSKGNREMALQVQSDQAHSYLVALFDYDWSQARLRTYLPAVTAGHQPPTPAGHLLVSELYYVTVPDKEWVELYNPTGQTVSLAGYKIGDAARPEDAEAMLRFPPGASIDPYGTVVVAVSASGFREEFPGHTPSFEIFDSDPTVPDLLDYPPWGTWEWGLSNQGDEVLLLNGDDVVVDVAVYGEGSYPGVQPHPGGIGYGHSLERYPVWLDTDDCSVDFRDWSYPSPGELP
jgi:phosphatidylserine/phosphatidylglycerophosphate/cardiolipin synthase-like enzyme